MKIIISHLTAYRYLSNYAARQTRKRFVAHWDPLDIGRQSRATSVTDITARINEIEGLDLNFLGIPLDRIDLLVTDQHKRSAAPNIVNHVCSKFQPVYGSLIALSSCVYVCSPELCFVQMASTFDFVDLVEFGFELCGGYALSTHQEKGFSNRIPLTSKEHITRFLDRLAPSNAVNKSRRALTYIADHSASPRETTFTMLETLPKQVGGYGFELPYLNYKFSLEEQDMWKRKNYYCDIYWPQYKLAIEYSGTMAHGEHTAYADNERENIIELGGIRVLRISAQQLSNANSLDLVSRRIASYMGKRIRTQTLAAKEKREHLREYLYNRNRTER